MKMPRLILVALLAALWVVPAAIVHAQEKIDLGVIIVKEKKLADTLRQDISQGKDFSALAMRYSVGPSAARGGRLGLVPTERLRSEYKKAVKGLAPGQPSQVIPTEEGYSILMIFSPETGAPAAPAAAKPQGGTTAASSAQTTGGGGQQESILEEAPHLVARRLTMAGLEAMVAGDLPKAVDSLNRARAHDPHETSAAFLLDMANAGQRGELKMQALKDFALGFNAFLDLEGMKALDLFEKARKEEPRLWQADLFRAGLLSGTGKYEQAKKLLQTVLAEHPDTPLAYVTLGTIAMDQEERAEAQKYFQKALELDPEQPQALYELGNIALVTGELDSAESYLKKALVAQPYNEEAYNDLGILYTQQDKLDLAEENLRKSHELNPDYAPSYLNLGIVFIKRNELNKAIDEFNKAVVADPGFAQAHMNLAMAYMIQENWDLAIQHADRAQALGFPVPNSLLEALKPHRVGEEQPQQ